MNPDDSKIPQNYGIERWGGGYFAIDGAGQVVARPDSEAPTEIALPDLAAELRAAGLGWPVLVRFVDILGDRVRALRRAFAAASADLDYGGAYCAIYPIKVNQQRSVIEHMVAATDEGFGLEAGSKPELLVVLAVSRPGGVIVCNGYKDAEYIRLALIGQKLGFRIYLVIEKPAELEVVLRESAALGIEPLLGVRVRLSAVAAGKWQNSGGEKSKFGLSAAQLLTMVRRLQEVNKKDRLQLLHSHIGSQIPNLRDIRRGMREVAHCYAELRRLGAPIGVVDVGGGLGIDYEGTGTRHFCSMNYGLDGYAREVVHAFAQVCARDQLPQPALFTESGRALTAHHAVLITDLIDHEPVVGLSELGVAAIEEHELLVRMRQELAAVPRRDPAEILQEARHIHDECNEAFELGDFTLSQRAAADQLFHEIADRVRARLRPELRRHRELLDLLNEQLAEPVFVNFSLFQSLPDSWAIEQVFPVMPLQRLLEPQDTNVVLHDLTCDSDGRIGRYVDQDGVEQTLPIHATRDGSYLLGFFLAGAYQEILGDMHNLFGDTHAVDVELDGKGGFRMSTPEPGDGVDDLLRYIHFDPQQMLECYRARLDAEPIDDRDRENWFAMLAAGLKGYTYLTG